MKLFAVAKQKFTSMASQTFHESFELGEVLGKGSFGQVRVGRCRHSGEKFAVKIVDLRRGGKSSIDHDLASEVKAEAALAKTLGDHPNCVQMFKLFAERNLQYLVMEKCKCSLLDAMKDQPEVINLQLVNFFRQGLQGIAHCHSLGLVHRDVKPENFLLGGPDGTTLKLCDFGFAVQLPKKGLLHGVFGTAPYMSPEMLGSGGYSYKTDVWSFAVVAYLLLFGDFPYVTKVRSPDEMKKAIICGTPTPKFSQDGPGNFAKDLLQRDPSARCTAQEALHLDFLKPKIRRSVTCLSESSTAADIATVVSKEFKAPADPGRTNDLNELLDDLQEKGQRLYLHQEQSANKSGLESFSLPVKDELDWDARSTQVPTNETLPKLDWASEDSRESDESDDDEEEVYKATDNVTDIWDPAIWRA